MRARDQRAKICRWVKRITDAHLCDELRNAGDKPLEDVALRVEARGCCAVLPAVNEGTGHCATRSRLNVRISKDNERRLATKL